MVLENYKKIWIPSTDQEACFPETKMGFWWFMAAAGLLCNVLYSIALLTGMSFVPFHKSKVSGQTCCEYSYIVCEESVAVLGICWSDGRLLQQELYPCLQ
jgi:hypothetical protein